MRDVVDPDPPKTRRRGVYLDLGKPWHDYIQGILKREWPPKPHNKKQPLGVSFEQLGVILGTAAGVPRFRKAQVQLMYTEGKYTNLLVAALCAKFPEIPDPRLPQTPEIVGWMCLGERILTIRSDVFHKVYKEWGKWVEKQYKIAVLTAEEKDLVENDLIFVPPDTLPPKILKK